jgi:hypothetical protein
MYGSLKVLKPWGKKKKKKKKPKLSQTCRWLHLLRLITTAIVKPLGELSASPARFCSFAVTVAVVRLPGEWAFVAIALRAPPLVFSFPFLSLSFLPFFYLPSKLLSCSSINRRNAARSLKQWHPDPDCFVSCFLSLLACGWICQRCIALPRFRYHPSSYMSKL